MSALSFIKHEHTIRDSGKYYSSDFSLCLVLLFISRAFRQREAFALLIVRC